MADKRQLHEERLKLIVEIEHFMEGPITFLGFVWLVLLVIEMTHGLSKTMQMVSVAIWVIFIIDFVLRFIIAPDKIQYLKKEWLIALSLFIPAIRFVRIFRVFRILGLLQGSSIVTLLGTVNRSIRSLNKTLRRRGFVYIIAITIAVTLLGAAGMYAFEKGQPGSFQSYADAVWWTTMLIITIGSQYWPQTAAGKLLSLLISIFGFTVLGYITATLASFFVGQDASGKDAPVAGSDDIAALRKQVEDLTRSIDELTKEVRNKEDNAANH